MNQIFERFVRCEEFKKINFGEIFVGPREFKKRLVLGEALLDTNNLKKIIFGEISLAMEKLKGSIFGESLLVLVVILCNLDLFICWYTPDSKFNSLVRRGSFG
jgi:hypothetical protein